MILVLAILKALWSVGLNVDVYECFYYGYVGSLCDLVTE